MRKFPGRLAAVAAVALATLLPTAPAHAAPGCGGPWTGGAACVFQAPAGAFGFQGVAHSNQRVATVTVEVLVQLGGQFVVIGSCTNTAPNVASCQGIVQTPFPGLDHFCRVKGIITGAYWCADPPMPVVAQH